MALDRATAWAEATRTVSVHRFDPQCMAAPRGTYSLYAPDGPDLSRRALLDILSEECQRAKIDDRIVERVVRHPPA